MSAKIINFNLMKCNNKVMLSYNLSYYYVIQNYIIFFAGATKNISLWIVKTEDQ